MLGTARLFQGDFVEAQVNLVKALSINDRERDRDRVARFLFGPDTNSAARVFLAITKWLLGEVGPARALIDEAITQTIEAGYVLGLINNYFYKAHFEMLRGDAGAVQDTAEIVVKLSQENGLTLYAICGTLASAWANARLDDGRTGATEFRQVLEAYIGQGNALQVPFYQGLLAELEAEGDGAGALTRIDEVLALSGETGEYRSDAFLHRLRGEISLKREPANRATAEEAFLKCWRRHSRACRQLQKFPEIEQAQTLLTTLTS